MARFEGIDDRCGEFDLEPGKWYAVVADSYGNFVVADTLEEALEEYGWVAVLLAGGEEDGCDP